MASDCGDLSLIPATAWRGCVKQIGKRLSETQWLIQASASRTQSRSCAPGLKKKKKKIFQHKIGLALKGLMCHLLLCLVTLTSVMSSDTIATRSYFPPVMSHEICNPILVSVLSIVPTVGRESLKIDLPTLSPLMLF